MEQVEVRGEKKEQKMKHLELNWENFVSLLISVISLLLAVLSYLKSRKVENQQYELNEHALKKIRDEEKDAKHAKLALTKVSRISDVEVKMRIANQGKCDADFVRYKIVNESLKQQPKGMYLDGIIPERVGSGESFEFILHTWTGDKLLEMEITWEDNAGPWSKIYRVQLF